MARKKQRETYGDGSISPMLVDKKDKSGNSVIDPNTGKAAKVQKHDKKGNPVWRICITVGSEEVTGKDGKKRRRQKKVQKLFHGTLAEARRFRDKLAKEYENLDVESAQGSFKWTCEKWIVSIENSNIASKETIKSYKTRLGYMSESIGDKAIIEITPSDIDDAIASIKKARGLSNTTMHKVFAVTKRVFEFAIARNWLVRNPCNAAISPKEDEVTTRNSLDETEGMRLRAILDRDEEEAYREFCEKEDRLAKEGKNQMRSSLRGLSHLSGLIAIRIFLATGIRRGEGCGLTWSAIDFETGQIRIAQTLTARMVLKQPKSESGVRTLAVDNDTMQHLMAWRDFQAWALQMIVNNGVQLKQTADTPVICNDMGTWYDPTNLGRWWGGTGKHDGYRDEIGFPELKMHELRHTQATMLIGKGCDIKTVSHRLGHKKESLTLSQYTHAIPANDKAAADCIGSIFAPNKEVMDDVRVRKTA